MEEKKKVAFITLGCKVNTSETEGMKQLFQQAGYKPVGEADFADVYIVNTCTVTSMGDKKSRQMLRKAHALNPHAVIAAVGCYAQVSPDEAARIEGVNLVVGNNMKHRIVELVESTLREGPQKYVKERKALVEYEELPVDSYEGHTRAFLKIQDGCDQFCSYCIIPYARGPVRSRGMTEIIKEAMGFATRGFKEVVLTGIHLTSFGDENNGTGLADLIRKVHAVEGIERIRLGSLEPMFLTPEFIGSIKGLPKLCPHFHISLQSGSDQTLKRMNRKYTSEKYRSIVEALKEHIPGVTITTDVMVGFPGETEEEFQESYRFCEEMGFLWIHVFKYSPRQGTPAARFADPIDPKIKEQRSKSMIKLAEHMRQKNYERFVGQEMTVLLEQKIEGSLEDREDLEDRENLEDLDDMGDLDDMEGLTPNYIPVAVKVQNEESGEILSIKLFGIEGERMRGRRLPLKVSVLCHNLIK